MALQRHVIAATTNGSGDATVYSAYPVHGSVVAVVYVKTDFANGIDFTITGEQSGIAILTGTDVNATATYMPRGATHSTAGAAALYAAGGTAVLDLIPVAMERIKIVVAQGGDTKTGTFHVYVDA